MGCPQGSSFGPLLWNLFQNDLSYQIKNDNLFMYADDHQVYTIEKHIQTVEINLKKETELASLWYKENLLHTNTKKYQILTIKPKRKEQNAFNEISLNIDGNDIKSSKNLKILGVNLDDQLNFSEHISEICKRSSQKVGIILRLRNLIPTASKLELYKSSILPHLTYCHTVWHFCKASDKRKLERVQERALRAIFNTKAESYKVLLNKAKLPSLYNRRLQDIAILMYKVKKGISPVYINSIVENFDKGHSLRNADFHTPRFNTVQYGKHSLKYFGPYLWSKLSHEEREITSLETFKKYIRGINLENLIENNCINCNLHDNWVHIVSGDSSA